RQRAGPPDGLLYEKRDGALIEWVGYAAPLRGPRRGKRDRLLQLGLAHRRHQLAARGDGRVQRRIAGGRAQKIGAKGENNADPPAAVKRGIEQGLYKQRALCFRCAGEDFLEL